MKVIKIFAPEPVGTILIFITDEGNIFSVDSREDGSLAPEDEWELIASNARDAALINIMPRGQWLFALGIHDRHPDMTPSLALRWISQREEVVGYPSMGANYIDYLYASNLSNSSDDWILCAVGRAGSHAVCTWYNYRSRPITQEASFGPDSHILALAFMDKEVIFYLPNRIMSLSSGGYLSEVLELLLDIAGIPLPPKNPLQLAHLLTDKEFIGCPHIYEFPHVKIRAPFFHSDESFCTMGHDYGEVLISSPHSLTLLNWRLDDYIDGGGRRIIDHIGTWKCIFEEYGSFSKVKHALYKRWVSTVFYILTHTGDILSICRIYDRATNKLGSWEMHYVFKGPEDLYWYPRELVTASNLHPPQPFEGASLFMEASPLRGSITFVASLLSRHSRAFDAGVDDFLCDVLSFFPLSMDRDQAPWTCSVNKKSLLQTGLGALTRALHWLWNGSEEEEEEVVGVPAPSHPIPDCYTDVEGLEGLCLYNALLGAIHNLGNQISPTEPLLSHEVTVNTLYKAVQQAVLLPQYAVSLTDHEIAEQLGSRNAWGHYVTAQILADLLHVEIVINFFDLAGSNQAVQSTTPAMHIIPSGAQADAILILGAVNGIHFFYANMQIYPGQAIPTAPLSLHQLAPHFEEGPSDSAASSSSSSSSFSSSSAGSANHDTDDTDGSGDAALPGQVPPIFGSGAFPFSL